MVLVRARSVQRCVQMCTRECTFENTSVFDYGRTHPGKRTGTSEQLPT